MGNPNSRGQIVVEAFLLLFALSGILLAVYDFTDLSPQLYRGYQLSEEVP